MTQCWSHARCSFPVSKSGGSGARVVRIPVLHACHPCVPHPVYLYSTRMPIYLAKNYHWCGSIFETWRRQDGLSPDYLAICSQAHARKTSPQTRSGPTNTQGGRVLATGSAQPQHPHQAMVSSLGWPFAGLLLAERERESTCARARERESLSFYDMGEADGKYFTQLLWI